MQAQFAAMGVAVDLDENGSEDVAVWANNWRSLQAFLACQTTWRLATGAAVIWLGLDYPSVDIVLKHLGEPSATFLDLQVMERAALEVLQEPRE